MGSIYYTKSTKGEEGLKFVVCNWWLEFSNLNIITGLKYLL